MTTSTTNRTSTGQRLTAVEQRALLQAALPNDLTFQNQLSARGLAAPRRGQLRVLQLNLGKLCNMRCSHCHVDAGPHQGHTQMSDEVLEQCLEALERLRPAVLDLTGGARQFSTSCDIAKGSLTNAGIAYTTQAGPAGSLRSAADPRGLGVRIRSARAGCGGGTAEPGTAECDRHRQLHRWPHGALRLKRGLG